MFPPSLPNVGLNTRTALSFDAEPTKLSKYLPKIPDTHSVVVFVGAMAHGSVFIPSAVPQRLIGGTDRIISLIIWWMKRLPLVNTV